MGQKHVIILVVLILTGGLLTAGVSQFISDIKVDLHPTPTPSQVIFNTPQTPPSPTPTPRVIKQYASFPGVLLPENLKNKKAIMQTNRGVFEIEIYPEATKAASNFMLLGANGFYDGLSFHRVEPGFVVQGGDPLGNGTGGPGYQFEDEPVIRSYDRGIVAMANSGPNTNGSQFFIMLKSRPDLPPRYTIFGQVIRGMEVVDQIQVGDRIIKAIITSN